MKNKNYNDNQGEDANALQKMFSIKYEGFINSSPSSEVTVPIISSSFILSLIFP